MPCHDHRCVPMCTNRRDRCTNLSFHTFSREESLPHIFTRRKSSTHFHAKRVFSPGSSLPISEMKEKTSPFGAASAVVCSERFLPSDYPPWTRFGEGEAGLQAPSPEAEVETRGSSAGLSVGLH